MSSSLPTNGTWRASPWPITVMTWMSLPNGVLVGLAQLFLLGLSVILAIWMAFNLGVLASLAITGLVCYPLFFCDEQVRARKSDIALLPDQDDRTFGLVTIRVESKGKVARYDRGVIWVADNLLHFYGHCCYFALGGSDFEVIANRRRAIRVCGRSTVVFDPLPWIGDMDKARSLDVLQSARMLSLSRPVSDEPRVLPPA